jgi:hypothetical protein
LEPQNTQITQTDSLPLRTLLVEPPQAAALWSPSAWRVAEAIHAMPVR